MQRMITALVALFSLLAANLMPAIAQRPGSEGATAPGGARSDILELSASQSVPYLVVRDKVFILEGHVAQDVMAINCDTIIKPGATVGNVLTAVGGRVQDESGGSVRVVQQSADLLPALQQTIIHSQTFNNSLVLSSPPRESAVEHKQNWLGGQFALFLLGLLAGGIALVVAPRAAEQTGDTLKQETGRCLVVGVMGAALMLFALCLSYGLMRSPFGPVWTPIGAGFAGLCLGALAFGWVCSLRYVGQFMARRLNRLTRGGMLLQFGLGLTAFFLACAVLGSISQGLGVVCLLLEFTLALCGLGAALLTGFGADPNWLTARLNGEVRWLSRSTRL